MCICDELRIKALEAAEERLKNGDPNVDEIKSFIRTIKNEMNVGYFDSNGEPFNSNGLLIDENGKPFVIDENGLYLIDENNNITFLR